MDRTLVPAQQPGQAALHSGGPVLVAMPVSVPASEAQPVTATAASASASALAAEPSSIRLTASSESSIHGHHNETTLEPIYEPSSCAVGLAVPPVSQQRDHRAHIVGAMTGAARPGLGTELAGPQLGPVDRTSTGPLAGTGHAGPNHGGTEAVQQAQQQQQHPAPPARKRGRKKRTPPSAAAGPDADAPEAKPLRRSKRVKQEVDSNEHAIVEVAALSSMAAAGTSTASPPALGAGYPNAPGAATHASAWPTTAMKLEGSATDETTAKVKKEAEEQHAQAGWGGPTDDLATPMDAKEGDGDTSKGKAKSETAGTGKGRGKGRGKGKAAGDRKEEEPEKGSEKISGKGTGKGKGKGTGKGKQKATPGETPSSGAAVEKPKRGKRKSVNVHKEEVENDPSLRDVPKEIKDRIIRVLSQRMFLINRFRAAGTLKEEFDILGSVGDVYKVTIAEQPKCTCMDNRVRKNLCKHLLFVFLKVLRLPRNSPLFLQRGMMREQLIELFDAARPNPIEEGAQASKALRRAWEVSVGLRLAGQESDGEEDGGGSSAEPSSSPSGKRLLPVEGDSCPICYEDLDAGSSIGLTFCLSSCGRPVHDECFQQWSRSKGGVNRGNVTCVWCRAPWPALTAAPAAPPASQARKNGYGVGLYRGAVRALGQSTGVLNLADVAGVSRKRGTSSQGD